MAKSQLGVLKQRFVDSNGTPLAGGKVYSYTANTVTPLATYTDASGLTPNTNPIILDANGECDIFIGAEAFKFIVTDANDVQRLAVDNWVAPGIDGQNALVSAVTDLQAALLLKADQSTVSVLITAVAGKADTATVSALSTTVAGKADSSTVSALATTVSGKADASALTSHTGNTSNPHVVTKAQVGLANADNTSDLSKPISTLTQTALDLKAPVANPDFTGSIQATQISTPSTPSAGKRKLYPKTDGWYDIDSTGTELKIGSGGGGAGSLRSMFQTDFETSITIAALYNDGAAAAPVDGTGGTASLLALSHSTTSPISGLKQLLLTKSVGNAQGQGFALTPISIGEKFRGKVVQAYIPTKLMSGFYPDQGLSFYFYDITNSVLVPVLENQFLPLVTSGVYEHALRFVPPYNCASGRFIVHVNSVDTAAYAMGFDDIEMSLQLNGKGFAGTDLQSVGSLIIQATTTAPSKGTIVNDVVRVAKHGDHAKIKIEYKQSAASGSAGSGDYLYVLPNSMNFDSNKVSFYTGDVGSSPVNTPVGLGVATLSWATFSFAIGTVVPYDATRFRIFGQWANATGNSNGAGLFHGSTFYQYSIGPITVTADFEAPILGWSSSTVMSSDVSGRPIVAKYRGGSYSYTANTPINFGTLVRDTSGGAVTTGVGTWRFTAQQPGDYDLDVSATNGAGATTFSLWKNNAQEEILTVSPQAGFAAAASTTVFLQAREWIDVRNDNNGTLSPYYINIKSRNSGSQQIAATERIEATYGMTTGQAVGNNTVIKYDTKVEDTHGRYDTATGLFTSNFNGKLSISVTVNPNAAMYAYVRKNGTGVGYLLNVAGGSIASGSISIPVLVNDTVSVYTENACTINGTNPFGYGNQVTFKRST